MIVYFLGTVFLVSIYIWWTLETIKYFRKKADHYEAEYCRYVQMLEVCADKYCDPKRAYIDKMRVVIDVSKSALASGKYDEKTSQIIYENMRLIEDDLERLENEK